MPIHVPANTPLFMAENTVSRAEEARNSTFVAGVKDETTQLTLMRPHLPYLVPWQACDTLI